MYVNTQGRPITISFDSNGKRRTVILQEGAVFDASFYGASNVMVEGQELFKSTLKDISSIVQKAIIVDFETTGKVGGSVITEAAVYNAEKNVVDVFFLQPYHMVNLGEDDFFEAANLSSKKGRQVVNVKSSVAPRSFASSFFTKHLTELILKHDLQDKNFVKLINTSEPIVKIAGEFLAGNFKNRLELEESILRLDKQTALFDDRAVRDAMLKYTAEVDRYQTRYYLNDMDEAKRLGITNNLFQTAEDRRIHELTSYLRTQSGVADTGHLERLRLETENILRQRYSVDAEVRARVVSPEEFIQRSLPNALRGGVVYAANAPFESKQAGALLRGITAVEMIAEDPTILELDRTGFNDRIEKRLLEKGNPFEEVIKGVSYTGDPFYVTGEEFNLAKGRAQVRSDYGNLLSSFLKTTDIKDVRDILDIERILQGTANKLGIMEVPKPQALSLEVQGRLIGAAQEIMQGGDIGDIQRRFLEKEAHVAAADVAATSPKPIGAGLSFSIAGEELARGTELGRYYYEEALQKRGPLYGLFAYSGLSNVVTPTVAPDDLGLLDILFEQRVARNLEKVVDIDGLQTFGNVEGYKYMEIPTYHVNEFQERVQIDRRVPYAQTKTYKGMQGIYDSSRMFVNEYAGVQADEALTRLFRDRINKDDMLLDFDPVEKQYKLPTLGQDATLEERKSYAERMNKIRMRARRFTESNAEQIEVFRRRAPRIQAEIEAIPDRLKQSMKFEEMQRMVNVQGKSKMERAIEAHDGIKLAKRITLPVMGFGLAMSGLSALESFQQPERSSLLIPSYHDWFEQQAQMFGNAENFTRAMREKTGYIEGMQETGLSAELRKAFTDFGSPYTGPAYSDSTLEQNELLRQRQRYLRHIYTSRHLDQTGDIKNMLSVFTRSTFSAPQFRPEDNMRTLLSSGSEGATPFTSLKGQNLTRVNLKNYQIDVQDADTITLRRNIGRGPMKDFFFGRKDSASMSIRLAGIDAPETAHQNRGAQPYAEAAKRIAMDMISRAKNVDVVFDDSDSTYGRRVGVVYADGVNVNLELIKRGAAAYLPYRSHKKRPIYDEQEFRSAEQTAYRSKRGMWRTDYFNSYKQLADASGQTVTFNTLVNTRKVAQNTSLMTMYSTMKTADAFGMSNSATQQAIAEAGLSLKTKAAKSRGNIFKPDYNSNEWTEPNLQVMQPTNSIMTDMQEMQFDLSRMLKTKAGNAINKHSALKVKSMDLELAEETASAKYNSFNKDYQFKYNEYNRRARRLSMMQAMQHRENHRIFNYRTGHHRM